jgi:hypothetical protein
MFFRTKTSGSRSYLQVVENRWEGGRHCCDHLCASGNPRFFRVSLGNPLRIRTFRWDCSRRSASKNPEILDIIPCGISISLGERWS